jgi:DNA repair protein RadD
MSIAEPQTEISLRGYQVHSIDGVHDLMRGGKKRILLVLPTGSGKRTIAIWWLLRALKGNRRVLFVTDRTLLVDQPSDELREMAVGHGVIMGGILHEFHHDIQLATIQALQARESEYGLPQADLIIIDESHKAIDAYKWLLAYYPSAKAVLLTATPVGPNGKTLVGDYADSLFEGATNSQLIREGYLLPTRIFAPSEPDIQGVRVSRTTGEYSDKALGKRIQAVTCFANLFDEWSPFADRQTIVFAPSIDYANGLVQGPGDSFKARGIQAEALTSKLRGKEQDRIVDAFRAGELRVLVSVDMLREGFDVPAASCAVDLQTNKQLRTYWQKVGRIKRPHHDQQYAIYVDMAGNSWRFPHPDDDPTWPAGDEDTQSVVEKEFESSKRPRMIRCPRCGHDHKPPPKCPECHYEPTPHDVIRVIRMGNGKLKEIRQRDIQKVQKSEADKRRDAWRGALFAGMNTGKTLSQCRWIFKNKTGNWPFPPLPCMPDRSSAEWDLRVDQVYSKADIMRNFETTK